MGRSLSRRLFLTMDCHCFCNAVEEDYGNLDEYAATRSNSYNVFYEKVCAEVMGARQKEPLYRMIEFGFQRHPRLDLPEKMILVGMQEEN